MPFTRRETLRNLIAGAAGAGFARTANAGESSPAPPSSPTPASQPPGTCTLFPRAAEGPFYFDPKLVRQDIAEGRPGAPLELRLRLTDAKTCQPVRDARADIWHCDARGIYSGYDGQGDDGRASAMGETYLRGTQMTDADGVATFRTVYPGWYPGRTPHIHIKVFLDKRSVLTGQAYFPDEVSSRIYRERAPYNARPAADTSNVRDFIFMAGGRDGGGTVLALEDKPGLMVGRLDIAVGQQAEAGAIRRWLFSE